MWRLKLSIKLLEALTMREQTRLSDMSIDDDIALALKLLRKAQSIYTSKK